MKNLSPSSHLRDIGGRTQVNTNFYVNLNKEG